MTTADERGPDGPVKPARAGNADKSPRPAAPAAPAGEVADTAATAETDGIASGAAGIPPALVFRWAVAGAFGVLVVLLGAWALYSVRGILVLVVIALFVAVSLDPAVRWLVGLGLRRSMAVSLVLLFVIGMFAAFIWSIAPPLVREGARLFADLPAYVQELPQKFESFRELSERYDLANRLSGLAAEVPGKVAGSAVGFVQQFFGAVLSTLLVLVLTIYFMADMPRMRRGLVRLFPHRRRPQVADIVDVVVDKVGAYMIGNLIISLFAGVSTFLCLQLLGVPFALPLALTVAITDLIPMIGATLGATLCVLVTVVTTDLWPTTVIVAVFFFVYQQIENYLIVPRVLRNTVDLPAAAVLLVALIGGSVLGVVGALMAIPIAAAVRVLITPTIAAMHKSAPPSAPVSDPQAD